MVVRYTELETGGRPGVWRDAFRGRIEADSADYEFTIRHTPNIAEIRFRFTCPERFGQTEIESLEIIPVPTD